MAYIPFTLIWNRGNLSVGTNLVESLDLATAGCTRNKLRIKQAKAVVLMICI